MAGKRLLDAARLFGASRNVAGQHFKIRSEQLDVWSKTSSIAKAVKHQTDRVTLTAQAASALAKRFAEDPPTYTTNTQRTQDEQGIPRQDSVDHKQEDSTERHGLKQDHHYKREEENATSEPAKEGEIGVQQEKPARYPTADGTLPPRDAPVDSAAPTSHAPEIVGQRADEAPTKDPVQQEGQAEIKPASSGQSTIAQPRAGTQEIPKQEAVPEQEEVPEGINTDIFHSPRIATLLGNKKKDQGRSPYEKKPQTAKTPIDQTELHKDKDQDTFNVRESGQKAPAGSEEQIQDGQTKTASASPEEMQTFAADLANDAETSAAAQAEVSSSLVALLNHQAKLIR